MNTDNNRHDENTDVNTEVEDSGINGVDNDKNDKKERKNSQEDVSLARMLFDIAETLALSTCAVVLIFTFIVRLAIVDGPSMMNTLEDSDALIVSDLAFEPKYGDIVVFQKLKSSEGEKALVKRVIATENQVVDIDFDTWTVTVDGVPIDEEDYRYLATDRRVTSEYDFPVTVPEGYVFVMGDNRNHSMDSRSKTIGFVDTREIFGRVLCRVFPLSGINIFERFS